VTAVVLVVALTVALVGGVVGVLMVTTGGADQADVQVDGAELVVTPVGMMKVWALSSGVRVPLADVAAARAVDRATLPLGFRAPGSYFPGVVCAGTYRKVGSKGLWMVGRSRLVLDLELRGERYQRVVVQVADPVASAATVERACGR